MLRFWSKVFGPVFAKEMVETARRKRYYFNRVLLLTVVLIGSWIVWEETAVSYRYRYGRWSAINVMSQLAQNVFVVTSVVQFIAIFLFVPVFLCGCIAGERDARTLELLFTTKLNDREIVLGKLASRLVLGLQLLFCVLPVVSIMQLFGGVDLKMAVGAYIAMLFACIYAGAHAIYFSTKSKSPLAAMVRTYWWMTVWILGLPLLSIVFLMLTVKSSDPIVGWFWLSLTLINPVGPFFLATVPGAYTDVFSWLTANGGQSFPLFLMNLLFFPSMFVIPFLWSCLLIRLAVRDVRREPAPILNWRGPRKRIAAAKTHLAVALQRLRPPAFRKLGRISNPLVWRAAIAAVYDREGHIRRVQFGGWCFSAVMLTLLAAHPGSLSDDDVAIAFLGFAWLGLGLLTTLTAASSLAGDRRRGFLDLLLATPLTPAEIIGGSVWAVYRHIRIAYWLVLTLSGFFWLTGGVTSTEVCMSLISGTLWMVLLILTGVACSLTTSAISVALIMTLSFVVFMAVGSSGFLILDENAVPAAWFACLVFPIGAHIWASTRFSTISVGVYLLAMHFFLTGLGTFWSFSAIPNEFPLFFVNPAFQIVGVLDGRMPTYYRGLGEWWMPIVGYWAAVVVNLVWMWYWVVHQFDRCADRILQDAPIKSSTPALPPKIAGRIALSNAGGR